jgi:hypothetical protein
VSFYFGGDFVEVKKKFILELDEEPALVFVQKGLKCGFTLYQDGKEVKGIRNLKIYAGYDSITTHEIEYVTGATK